MFDADVLYAAAEIVVWFASCIAVGAAGGCILWHVLKE